MIRRLTLATVASIAAIGAAGTAVAASGHAATTYRASLTAVNPGGPAPVFVQWKINGVVQSPTTMDPRRRTLR